MTCFLQNHQYDDNNDGDDDDNVDHGDSDDDGDDVEDDSWQWSPCRGLPHYSFSAPTHLGNTCETHCVHQLVHSCTNQYSPVPTTTKKRIAVSTMNKLCISGSTITIGDTLSFLLKCT